MDILRKMFKMNEDEGKKDPEASAKDEFRKPQWFEESETDDELFDDDRKFAVQIFTNPMELQKHFERQMQQILEAVSEFDDSNVKVEKDLKEEYLKPGFEGSFLKEFEKQKANLFDTDLDGEIYADQLHSLMQRLNSADERTGGILPRNDNKSNRMLKAKKKLSDEETILGKIHGTLVDEDSRPRISQQRPDIITPPMMPRGVTPFGGVFEGTYQGPKMFRQSVMTKTIRKPDGTYETTKITQDSEGNKTTTVTRTLNGKTETVTTYDGSLGGAAADGIPHARKSDDTGVQQVYSDRNIYVTKQGYAVPRNLW